MNMSSFWSGWIIVISLGQLIGLYFLLKGTMKIKLHEKGDDDETTGHSWDNIAELDNPLPRWWLWMFYITMVFGAIYFVLYPGLGNMKGTLGWTQQGQYDREVDRADDEYGYIYAQFSEQKIEDIANDEDAIGMGRRLFLNNCAVCHGSDARGAKGFPNLTDHDWLYGGESSHIKTSILNGRNGVMPAYAQTLKPEEISQTVAYVRSLSGLKADETAATAGKAIFNTHCMACHGTDGKGNQMLGAPNLTDEVWLYGGSTDVITQTVTNGRGGVMPAFTKALGEEKVHLLATYVYSLSQEKAPAAE